MRQTHKTTSPPPSLRLTFAERTAFPQVWKSPELVHTQELAEVELERCGWSDSYRLLVWLPVTADLRVDSVITLGGIEWVIRALTPRADRYGLSPGPAGGLAGSRPLLRLADTAGV